MTLHSSLPWQAFRKSRDSYMETAVLTQLNLAKHCLSAHSKTVYKVALYCLVSLMLQHSPAFVRVTSTGYLRV